MTGEESIS